MGFAWTQSKALTGVTNAQYSAVVSTPVMCKTKPQHIASLKSALKKERKVPTFVRKSEMIKPSLL